jgi:hypothetical protein
MNAPMWDGLSRSLSGDVAPLGREVAFHPGYSGVGLHKRLEGLPPSLSDARAELFFGKRCHPKRGQGVLHKFYISGRMGSK